MNAPLPFDQTASFAGVAHSVAGSYAGPMTPYPLHDRSGNGENLDFVERRRTDAGMSDNLVRSRAVLGFVGLVWGLVVSAVLIIGVSVGLALTGVSWMVAGQYCVAIILLVFGLVGIVLYWGTRTEHPCTAGIQQFMASAVERRRPYLYLSSINALENARRLGMWKLRSPRGDFDTIRDRPWFPVALAGSTGNSRAQLHSVPYMPRQPLNAASFSA